MSHLRKGASLVANDIDSFTPGLTALATVLEKTLSAKVQANLYCSWKEHQAFDHFDTHDVYAIQLEGEKLAYLRGLPGQPDRALALPRHDQGPARGNEGPPGGRDNHASRRRDLSAARPLSRRDRGDGELHARDLRCRGLDWHGLSKCAAFVATSDPLFRADCPRPAEGRQSLAAYLAELAERASDLGASDAFAGEFAAWQAGFLYPRGGFDLPVELEDQDFQVRAGFELVWKNEQALLTGPRGALPVPAGLEEAVGWIVGCERFTRADFAEAAPQMDPAERSKLLGDLVNMKVLEQR